MCREFRERCIHGGRWSFQEVVNGKRLEQLYVVRSYISLFELGYVQKDLVLYLDLRSSVPHNGTEKCYIQS